MALNITTHYKQPLTSKMLNHKVSTLAGGNIILEGFEVSKNNNTISIAPGKCIIQGAIIESDEAVTIQAAIGGDLFVGIEYLHESKKVNFFAVSAGEEIGGNKLLLAQISGNVTCEEKMRSIMDLSSSLKSIKENMLDEQELEYEGESIVGKDSVAGATSELKIKGQTVVNVAPIREEVDVYADLQATSDGSIKFDNTGDGIIDGINIKGKTYQNLINLNSHDWVIGGSGIPTIEKIANGYRIMATTNGSCVIDCKNVDMFKPNKIYTLIIDVKIINSEIKPALSYICPKAIHLSEGRNIIQFTTSDNLTTGYNPFRLGNLGPGPNNYGYEFTNIIVLEGDHTANPDLPAYFEGIKGVGDKSRNLFDGKNVSIGYLTATGAINASGTTCRVTDYIEVKSNTSYTVNNPASETHCFYDSNKNFISYVGARTFITPINCKYVRCTIKRADYDNTFQLEEGSTATPYEPYYDGHKIEILSHGKNLWNGEFEVGSIDTTTGLDNNLGTNRKRSGYIRVSPNTKYIIKQFDHVSANDNIYCHQYKEVGGEHLTNLVAITGTAYLLTTTNNTNYIRFRTENDRDLKATSIQIEEGDTATAYEPYKESKVTHYLREPLMSLPNGVCDEIVGNKLIRRVGKRIFDGDESFNIGGGIDSTENHFKFYNRIVGRKVENEQSINFLCDTFKVEWQSNRHIDDEFVSFDGWNENIVFSIKKSRLVDSSLDSAKQWLSQNPTTVYYELAEPIITPLDNDVILPNGVHDQVIGDKAIRNIGQLVLDGSEGWDIFETVNNNDTIAFVVRGLLSSTNANGNNGNFISDKLKFKDIYANSVNNDGMLVHLNEIRISVLKSRLETQDVAGFKKWLSQNPIKIWYEFKEPYYDTVKIPKLNSYKSQTSVIGSTLIPTPLNIESYGYKKEALIKPSMRYTIHFNNKFSDESFKNIKVDLGGAVQNVTANNSWLMLTITTPATLAHKELRVSGYGIKVSNVMCSEGSEYRDFIDGLASVGNKSKNLFNKNKELTLGAYFQANGDIQRATFSETNKNFIDESYYEIKSKHLTWSGVSPNTMHPLGICFYTDEKQFIERIEQTNVVNITIPPNAKYYRIKGDYSRIDVLQLEENYKATSYERYYDGHKIEILSNGKNLYNIHNDIALTYGISKIEEGTITTNALVNYGTFGLVNSLHNVNSRIFDKPTKIVKGKKYSISCKVRKVSGEGNLNYFAIFGFKKHENSYMHTGISHSNLSNINLSKDWLELKYSNVATDNFDTACPCFQVLNNVDNLILEVKDIQIEEADASTLYEPYQEDKTQILLQEPLRSLPNGVCDTIEEVDGNYVVVRRCGEVTLEGDNDWLDWIFRKESSSHDQIRAFKANSSWLNMDNIEAGSSIYTDVRITASHAWNTSAWYDKAAKIAINNNINQRDAIELMFKTELGIDSIEKFNKYMVKNPIKLIYKLATPTTHPLNHLVLPNKVADEVSDGKRIKKVGKVILDGSENWQAFTDDGDYIAFTVLTDTVFDNAARPISNSVTNVLSPSFKSVPNKDNGRFMFNCISLNPWDNFWVRIQTNQLETPDVAGFKKWLKENPTTVWYELAKPAEEDYNSRNLNLNTYNEVTHITSNTLVPAIINVKMPSTIGSVIKNDIERIEKIEDWIDKVILPSLVESHYQKTLLEFDYVVSRMLK